MSLLTLTVTKREFTRDTYCAYMNWLIDNCDKIIVRSSFSPWEIGIENLRAALDAYAKYQTIGYPGARIEFADTPEGLELLTYAKLKFL